MPSQTEQIEISFTESVLYLVDNGKQLSKSAKAYLSSKILFLLSLYLHHNKREGFILTDIGNDCTLIEGC